MNERPDMRDWEDQVNALLDGELDEAQAEALKAAAEQDRALARAIIEAYQLQQAMARLPLERAPASLRRKLRRIPRERALADRPAWRRPAWVAVAAAVPLALVVVSQLGPKQPSAAEIAQAQQDLAVAFAYLDKVGRRTSQEIESTVGNEMNQAVTGNMVRAVTEQFQLNKEQGA